MKRIQRYAAGAMRRRFILSVLASDMLALILAFSISTWIVLGAFLPWQVQLRGAAASNTIWAFAGLLATGLLIGSFLNIRATGNATPRPSYGRAFAIDTFMVGFAAIGTAILRTYHSNAVLGLTAVLWLVGALTHRAVRRRRPWTDSMVLITGEKSLVDDLRRSDHADIIAVYDPGNGAPEGLDPTGISLVVDLRHVLSEEMAQFVSSWNIAGYPVQSLTSVYEQHTGRLPIVHLAEGWELTAPMERNEYAPYKRIIDIVLVTLTLPLWALLAGAIALWVRMDSKGPVIYRQERLGLGGKPFTLYKFRTMVTDAESEGPRFASRGDTRLTRSGKWLRRFRIDEIPQLWNVFRGDLSLVGPRPERPVFTRRFELTIPFYRYRTLVRPGLTGWAQVNYGYADDEAQTVDKLTYDLYYVKHMSPWLDLEILGRSLWTVMSGFGAQ